MELLSRTDLAEQLPLWASSFVAWSESPYGFYVDRYWNAEKGRWSNSKRPIVWPDKMRPVLEHCFTLRDSGRLPYSEIWWIDIGKSGKTLLGAGLSQWAGMFLATDSELKLVANSERQSDMRVFQTLVNSILWSPYGHEVAEVQRQHIYFKKSRNKARALPAKASTQAGGDQVLVHIDEIWAYEGESAANLFAELKAAPTRNVSVRVITSYPGFLGDDGPMNEMLDSFFTDMGDPKEGVETPIPESPFYVRGGTAIWWNHEPYPWHLQKMESGMTFLEEQRASAITENNYRRIWQAQRVQREDTFIPVEDWDTCTDYEYTPISPYGDYREVLCIGVDIGIKHDKSACVARSYNPVTQKYELRDYRIWSPDMFADDDKANVVAEVQQWILDLHDRHQVVAVYFDPHQFSFAAQQLKDWKVKMIEMPQGAKREESDTGYLELIRGHMLRNYPAPDLRDHVLHAVGRETRSGGIRIDKRKTTLHIDGAVADSMCCQAIKDNQDKMTRYRKRGGKVPTLDYKRVGQRISEALYG